jgi:hypothetical protein
MRSAVRDRYRVDPQLSEQARREPHLDPAGGWVSGLCAELTVIHGVLGEMLAPYQRHGRLRLLPHYRPVGADV